jgi:SAM-dependent methyltransferase
MVQMLHASGSLREALEADIQSAVPDADVLPDDMEERHEFMDAALADSEAFAAYSLMGDWHSRMHGRVAADAFSEIEEELKPLFEQNSRGPATLERNPELESPDYWKGVDFHRTQGGWDRNPNMGFIHGEIVHRKMVARLFPGGLLGPRLKVAAMAPKEHYDTILDMGASSGHFTTALQQTYPDAKITGVELSAVMLEHAHRTANANGWDWELYQRSAEDTGFDDNSFDLVSSFILLHELPFEAVRGVFAEALRVCKPGGDMIMSDVTRYADVDKLASWRADRGAKYGGEPHWRESATLDLAEIAKEAGFVDVVAEGIYPHVVQGRKP